MKKYKGFLIDLDGTTYFGKKRIPSAENFIRQVIARDIPFLFFTNNATQSPQEVASNLRDNFDLAVTSEMVYTPALALIDYLNKLNQKPSIYLVGEDSLHTMLEEAGYTIDMSPNADLVVQALHRQVDYDILSGAVQAILNGAGFIATNTDRLIPTEDGLKPAAGTLTAFIEYACQKSPTIIGKPHPPITQGAVEKLGIEKDELLLIGDSFYTDILAGINAGIDTLMLLTGVTSQDDVSKLPQEPTYIMNDLSEWDFSDY